MRVIARGPFPDFDLSVPDTFAVEDPGGGMRLVRRGKSVPTTREKLDRFLLEAAMLAVEPSFDLEDGQWAAVGPDGKAEVFPLSDEWQWRVPRSRSMLQSALAERDAERRSRGLEAAAAMSGVSLHKLVGRLESARRSPDEDLADVFMRVRPSGP
jgi:hypothetical protein